MAALLLSSIGGSLGGKLGVAGQLAGKLIGAMVGNALDKKFFGSDDTITRNREGPRLSDLSIMASTEGAPMARVYGRARLGGEMIWATQLEEVVTTSSETSGGGASSGGKGVGGGGGGGSRQADNPRKRGCRDDCA